MKKKSISLLVSLVLLLTVTVGATLAFLLDVTDPLINTFKPSKLTTTVEEEIEGDVKKNVTIGNTGDTSAYIRAAVVVTWQNAAGEVYGTMPVAGTDYTIAFNVADQTDPTGKWIKSRDTFYYWSNPVAPGATTGVLITEAKPLKAAPAAGYYLNIEILGSGIQSEFDGSGAHPATQAWGVVVNDDGSISKE